MSSQSYWLGFGDGSMGLESNNPFHIDTDKWKNYEEGYEKGFVQFLDRA